MISTYPGNNTNSSNEEEKAFCFYEHPNPGKSYHFYISGPIRGPKYYSDMVHLIKMSGPDDTIFIYLNTPGGDLTTGVQMITAMRQTQAHVVTVLEGEVCSLGTLLFLCGGEFIINEYSLMMIHNHSAGQVGKGHEYLAQAEATSTWFENIANDVYRDFLTNDELKQLLEGKDFWFQTDEIKNRLEKMVKSLKKRMKAEEKKK